MTTPDFVSEQLKEEEFLRSHVAETLDDFFL
jgi:hypothetical protein